MLASARGGRHDSPTTRKRGVRKRRDRRRAVSPPDINHRPARKAGGSMTGLRRHQGLVSLAAVALVCGGLAACSSSSSGKSPATGAPTLVMESSPETAITQAFNPFVATQAAYGMGATGLIYEPLIEFNLAAPPKFYPWLATSYAWSNGGKQITFPIPPRLT